MFCSWSSLSSTQHYHSELPPDQSSDLPDLKDKNQKKSSVRLCFYQFTQRLMQRFLMLNWNVLLHGRLPRRALYQMFWLKYFPNLGIFRAEPVRICGFCGLCLRVNSRMVTVYGYGVCASFRLIIVWITAYELLQLQEWPLDRHQLPLHQCY